MGIWNTKINGNDTFQDIYQNFFELYNQGIAPVDISKQIQEDFEEMFNDHDDRNNSLFGLAFAQWETKSLTPKTYKQVKEIIESGNDIKIWRELGADEKTINQRNAVLVKFLNQISVDKIKPKRRIRPKFEFETIDLVNITAPDHRKTLEIKEEYGDKKYIHTSGLLMWGQEGGSVLYFTGQGQFIAARWIDKKTLEITHDKNIIFEKQDDSAYFSGDSVKIIYVKQSD